MQFRPKELAKDFKDFQSGNLEALSTIISSEKVRLYDFTMRMIGQLGKSSDLMDEAIAAVEYDADSSETLQEFLVSLYKTTRNFGKEVWNSDTSKLENAAYQPSGGKELQNLLKLESQLRILPANQKEVILLRERYGFALDEVAEIMMVPASDVEILFAQGLTTLEENMLEHSNRLPEMILNLKPFSKPENMSPETQNLSLIMNDFKKTNKMASTTWRRVRIGCYLVILVLVWVFREEVREFLEPYTQIFNS